MGARKGRGGFGLGFEPTPAHRQIPVQALFVTWHGVVPKIENTLTSLLIERPKAKSTQTHIHKLIAKWDRQLSQQISTEKRPG